MKFTKSQKYLMCFILLLFTLFFFSIPLYVAPDSELYFWYLEIFNGNLPFSQWNVVRGPIMSTIIYLFNHLFGQNGFLVYSYLLYLINCFLLFKLLFFVVKKFNNQFKENLAIALFVILIVFNPIMIGYFHFMYTESTATTFAIIGCYMSIKFIDINYKSNKKEYLLYVAGFSCFSIILWFLKQPYVLSMVAPLLISVVLSIIKNHSKHNIFSKITAILVSMLLLFGTIKTWDYILISNNVSFKNKSSATFISNGLIEGATNLRGLNYNLYNDKNTILNYNNLKEEDKQEIIKILNKESIYKGYEIYDVLNIKNDYVIETVVLFKKENHLSSSEAVKFLVEYFKKYPKQFIEGYISNYLAIINIFPKGSTNPASDYFPIKVVINESFENETVALAYTYSDTTYLWSDSSLDENFHDIYNIKNYTPSFIQNIVKFIKPVYLNLFKFLFFTAPFIALINLIIFIKKSKKNIESIRHLVLTIIFAFATIQVIFHAIFGALIDRYISPVFLLTILGLIILLLGKEKKRI